MSRHLLPVVVASLSSMLWAFPAQAGTFLGASTILEGFYPNLSTPPYLTLGPVIVVDPGMEFPLIGNSFSSDVAATTIVLNSNVNGNNVGCGSGADAFNGLVFTFSGLTSPIASVAVNASSTLTPHAIFATCTQVFVDYQCLGIINSNMSTLVDVTFASGACVTTTSTSSTSSTSSTTTSTLPCAAAPLAGCRAAGQSYLKLRDVPPNIRKLAWKWRFGPLTTFAELGDPVNGTTSYALCVYDEAAGVPSLVFRARGPAGANWAMAGSSNCPWYRYIDLGVLPDGIETIRARLSCSNQARFLVKGEGPNLPFPGPALGNQYFRQDTQVIAQLVKSDGGPCWEARYSPPASVNSATQFKDQF